MGSTVGYARCSTDRQDLTAQRQQLAALGVPDERIYFDEGLTGTTRTRAGLDQALAAVREGDTFTVTKLDRLARSVPDALAILSQLSDRGVRFALGSSVYDWHDPFSRMFLQILAVVAEFEVNLVKQRTREGMAIAKSKGKLRGKQPTLSTAQQNALVRMKNSGDYTIVELAEVFKVSRPTVYRVLERTRARNNDAGKRDQAATRATVLPVDDRPSPDVTKYDALLLLPRPNEPGDRDSCAEGNEPEDVDPHSPQASSATKL